MALGGSAARRYAEAMLDLAVAEDAVGRYRESLDMIAAALGGASLRALRDASVPLHQRLAAVRASTAGEPGPIGGLVQLLVRRDRLGLLPAIARSFGELVDRREGISHARITTAVTLDAAQQREMVGQLEAAARTRIRATFAVDPTLLGGARVQLGDHLIDSSVRAQLDTLRTRLASS